MEETKATKTRKTTRRKILKRTVMAVPLITSFQVSELKAVQSGASPSDPID